MTKNLDHFRLNENMLMEVEECAQAFDSEGCEFGKVDDVFLGTFEKEGVPENVFQDGYIHVSGNLPSEGWVILPDQIEKITHGKVVTTVPLESLMKDNHLVDAFA